jgi:hypothetical protein
MSDLLDWTHAAESSLDLTPHAGRADEMAGPLAAEVAAGRLPFGTCPIGER